MASMVWCNSCKTVVWAYDQESKPLSGILNHMQLPCPKCGDVGNFDGWNGNAYEVGKFLETEKEKVYDNWSGLKRIASRNCKGVKWEISPTCCWFQRPDKSHEEYQELMSKISQLCQEYNK